MCDQPPASTYQHWVDHGFQRVDRTNCSRLLHELHYCSSRDASQTADDAGLGVTLGAVQAGPRRNPTAGDFHFLQHHRRVFLVLAVVAQSDAEDNELVSGCIPWRGGPQCRALVCACAARLHRAHH